MFEKLGIYGWDETQEDLLIASLVTGDPIILIGRHGSAKTYLAEQIAKALGVKFVAYDASKAMFEDVLGFPHIEKLKKGIIDYVPSEITIWDKDFVLIDELNRAIPEFQSKWLEIIRSRRITGCATSVKWVWSAMNPSSYSATQHLDDALIGRFAMFIYPPELSDMDEETRSKIARALGGSDAPALEYWLGNEFRRNGTSAETKSIAEIVKKASALFQEMRDKYSYMATWLAKFSSLISQETDGRVVLDGRRLGFMYRNILAVAAVRTVMGRPGGIKDMLGYVVKASIPFGLNESETEDENTIGVCVGLLESFFEDKETAETSFRLLTLPPCPEKLRLLLFSDVSDRVKEKVWMSIDHSIDGNLMIVVGGIAEARKAGIIPSGAVQTVLSRFSEMESPGMESNVTFHPFDSKYIDKLEELIDDPVKSLFVRPFSRVSDVHKLENLIRKVEEYFEILEEVR